MSGGIATFNHHICNELSSRGHRVTVLAGPDAESEDYDRKQNFTIKRVTNKFRPSSIESIYKTLALVRKENAEIIFFGHFASTHWLGAILVKYIFRIPYVILVHGTEFNAYFHRFTDIDRWVSKYILKNAGTVFTNSQITRELVQTHGYPFEKIHMIFPGVDTERFGIFEKRSDILENLGIKNKKILLTVSRLVQKKNHENVLKALAIVVKEIPDVVYIVVGDGKEKERLIGLTKELKIEKYVIFLGQIEFGQIHSYYNACDIFIMPSKTVGLDYESFGIVYLEANACGKPVIAGRSGGIKDAVLDGSTGILVDPNNIEEISQAMLLLLKDPEYAEKLGEYGRRRVEKELNWKMVGEKIEAVLATV